jgi:predicted short-subunit dehydrogenase-like oxidoreductase (DUF2520 family)
MDIVLVGSGNTATVLGRKSKAAGHRIVQVYSRNGNHANLLANRLGATSTTYISTVERNADLMIIAIRDEALSSFARDLVHVHSVVAHTAGAASIDLIRSVSKNTGVLYPLQSLRREIEKLPALTILVDANNPFAKKTLMDFAGTIAETVQEADDESRIKYHLAATIVNNFTNYLYTIAELYCKQEKISFSVLQPLMEETIIRLRNSSPSLVQTGVAMRDDKTSLEKHRELLKDHPSILKFYDLFTEEIKNAVRDNRL